MPKLVFTLKVETSLNTEVFWTQKFLSRFFLKFFWEFYIYKNAKYYAVTAIKGAYFPTLLFNRFRTQKQSLKLACINLFF